MWRGNNLVTVITVRQFTGLIILMTGVQPFSGDAGSVDIILGEGEFQINASHFTSSGIFNVLRKI